MTFDNVKRKKTVIPPIAEEAIGSKTHTRDPKVWRGKDAWYLVLGSSVDHKGRLLIYKSSDLQNWTYLSHVEKDNFGWMWECPDYFEMDGKGIMVFSPMALLNDEKHMIRSNLSVFYFRGIDWNDAACRGLSVFGLRTGSLCPAEYNG